MVSQETLTGYAQAIYAVRKAHPELANEQPTLFFRLLMPWLVAHEAEDRTQVAQGAANERRLLTEWGFPGETIANEVRAAFGEDENLAACCRSPLALSYVLDKYFVRPAADLISENALPRLGDLYAAFQNTIYGQGPFRLVAYSHVFNLNSALGDIDLGGMHLVKLSPERVTTLLGEPVVPSAVSFLQPPNVGNFFVVQVEAGAGKDEFEWFTKHHFRSIDMLRILQYSKDGVLHIDYSVSHFLPQWVNELRRSAGLFFLGTPRRIPHRNGTGFVTLTEADLPQLRRRLGVYLSEPMVRLLADETPAFRQASLRAGDYYERSLTYETQLNA
jgi:hypothetical protein